MIPPTLLVAVPAAYISPEQVPGVLWLLPWRETGIKAPFYYSVDEALRRHSIR